MKRLGMPRYEADGTFKIETHRDAAAAAVAALQWVAMAPAIYKERATEEIARVVRETLEAIRKAEQP